MNKPVSVEASFRWAQRFAAREWRIALPVVLAFFLLPPLAVDLLLPIELARIFSAPQARDMATMQGAIGRLMPLFVAVLVCAGAGTLALFAMALRPGISVGEAIRVGLRRLPVLIGALVLLFLGLVTAATLFSVAALALGVGRVAVQSLLMTGLIVGMLALGARLCLLGAVIVERRVGPIAAIGASWRLARGSTWRMLGAILIFLVGGFVVMLAINMAAGAILLLGARAFDASGVAAALAAIISRGGGALLNAGLILLAAAFYRQLDGPIRGI